MALLARRGLDVGDRDLAERELFHIGYWRLAPYAAAFEKPGRPHEFVAGTTFDDVLGLYGFDRELRLLVLDALARIEVAFRAALSEVMSMADGDAHWYTRPGYFTDANDFKVLQGNVAQALEQPLPVLADYVRRYATPELPPSWLMVEVLSIGQLNRVLQSLKRPAHRTAVAKALGLNDGLLSSWLEVFVRVRNICAHHERFFNVRLASYPTVPSGGVAWPEWWGRLLEEASDTLYCVFAAIQSMLTTIAPDSPWALRLSELLAAHPTEAEVMGFPADWRDDPFWHRAIRDGDVAAF